MKKSNKKVSRKKVVKKVVNKVSKKQSQELIIKVQPQELISPTMQQIIEPIHEGKKYSIEKTPFTIRQILSLVQPTPASSIYKRPGKGGKEFTYVTGNYVEKKLNFVFGFMWDFDVLEQGKEGDFIWVKGKLTAKLVNGEQISKTQFGRAEIKYVSKAAHKPENMIDYGNDLKAAATDCLKKCASLLGIASDVYGKQEYRQETGVAIRDEVVLQDEQKVAGPDGEPVFTCKVCGDPISEQEASFSKKVYGKTLCREDQKTAKRK